MDDSSSSSSSDYDDGGNYSFCCKMLSCCQKYHMHVHVHVHAHVIFSDCCQRINQSYDSVEYYSWRIFVRTWCCSERIRQNESNRDVGLNERNESIYNTYERVEYSTTVPTVLLLRNQKKEVKQRKKQRIVFKTFCYLCSHNIESLISTNIQSIKAAIK